MILSPKKSYLQIALNSTLEEAKYIINCLPQSDRIILEAGTPLIKEYGMEAVRLIYNWRKYNSKGYDNPYVVADVKTMDRAETEVEMVKNSGASGVICLGTAPVETLNLFVKKCRELEIDSMIDMMNIDLPVKILRKLRYPPDVVILHRGVDEETFNKNKPIPYLQINKILSLYDVIISIAGGDTIREVQRAVFNGAKIVVVWKEFYKPTEFTASLAEEFLKQIK